MTSQSHNETSGVVEAGGATAALEQAPAPAQAPLGTDAPPIASGAGAGLLREAAALMRERAEAAVSGRWEVYPLEEGPIETCEWALYSDDVGHDFALAEYEPTATHISSWHPAVALAVADWLESVHANLSTYNATRADHAFAVARAYLGGDQ